MSFAITARHHFYGQGDVTDLATWDADARGGNGAPRIYDTRADAKAALERLDTETYYTRHNESGRPSYAIRTVASLPQYLRSQL